MKAAVIILNYHSSADCAKCIRYIKQQEGIDVEIIVVDNGSAETDRENLERICQSEECSLLINKENTGYNAGNNVGLRFAARHGHQYALIANPDMEFPQTNYLSGMINEMEKDPSIAVCGSDIITPEGIHQSPMKRDGNWTSSFGWIKGFLHKKASDKYDFIEDYNKSHYCCKVSGCCILLRLSFVKEIGFFDEYPFLYCEEAILSRQVEQTDHWKMYYTAKYQAVHRHITKEKGNPIPRLKHWRRSRLYYIDQYSGYSKIGKTVAKFSTRLHIITLSFLLQIKQASHA